MAFETVVVLRYKTPQTLLGSAVDIAHKASDYYSLVLSEEVVDISDGEQLNWQVTRTFESRDTYTTWLSSMLADFPDDEEKNVIIVSQKEI